MEVFDRLSSASSDTRSGVLLTYRRKQICLIGQTKLRTSSRGVTLPLPAIKNDVNGDIAWTTVWIPNKEEMKLLRKGKAAISVVISDNPGEQHPLISIRVFQVVIIPDKRQ